HPPRRRGRSVPGRVGEPISCGPAAAFRKRVFTRFEWTAGTPAAACGRMPGRQGATMAQTQTFNGRRRVRKFFGHIPEVAEMPNLIEVQKASYDQFLMVDEPKGGRADEGLQAVFKSVFPISDFS